MFNRLDGFGVFSRLQGGLRYNMLSFRVDLKLSAHNQTRKICLQSAQNEINLSFRTNRVLHYIDAK